MDLINIEGLELRCIVGLRSHERHREQPLRADIWLGLDLSAAARSGRISDTADYGKVADAVASLLRFREYRLLEVAAEETAAFLFAGYSFIKFVRIRLQKPEALAGRARTAAVEIERTRGAFGAVEAAMPFGSRIELLRTEEATIELLWIRPGGEVDLEADSPHLDWIPGETSAETRTPVIREAGESIRVAARHDEGMTIARCLRHELARPGS